MQWLWKSVWTSWYSLENRQCQGRKGEKHMINFPFPQMKYQGKPREENLNKVMEFVLLGLANVPQFQQFFFELFLVIYIVILMGNGTMLLITILDPALQTPVYFFPWQFFPLGNLLCISYSPQNAHEFRCPNRTFLKFNHVSIWISVFSSII